MATPKRNKRSYSGLSAAEVFALIGCGRLSDWAIDAPPRPPTPHLLEVLKRLNHFATGSSMRGKQMLIDALLAEIVPLHETLRVWKGMPLETDTLTGTADYLIAPFRDYLSPPLVGTIEASHDDFEAGEMLCLAEMHACRQKNEAAGLRTDVHGIVSNGRGWVFYRWDADDTEFARSLFLSTGDLPTLLSALDHVCAACAVQLPAPPP